MPAHSRRLGTTAFVAVALLGTSCGTSVPAAGGATTATVPASSAGAPGIPTGASGVEAGSTSPVAAPPEPVGRAHRAALGLIALGALGAEKRGAVGGLGERVTTDARVVDERVRSLATDSGLVLGDELDASTQALLADVGSRTGSGFDESWRGAVRELGDEAREAATAVRASASSDGAKAAARDVLARLDALDTALGAVPPPTVVPAGSGGQAAAAGPLVPVALVGLGAVLLAAAVRLRRSGR